MSDAIIVAVALQPKAKLSGILSLGKVFGLSQAGCSRMMEGHSSDKCYFSNLRCRKRTFASLIGVYFFRL